MTIDQKTTWIQYFQYLHSIWAEDFAKKLSLGQCVDTALENNVIISNLIEIFYRYKPFDSEITNAYKFKINYNEYSNNNDFELTYNQNGIDLFTFVGNNDEVINYIILELNSTPDLIAFYSNSYIYVYTYDNSYNYSDLPIITIVEDSEDDITVTIESLLNETNEILDTMNCLTLKEMCLIKEKLLSLLNNINCN